MSNLSETSTWEAGVYQLERTDPVDAGVGGAGVSNLQAKQLANRTLYLKNQIEKGFNFRSVSINPSSASLSSADFGYLFAWDENAVNGTYNMTLPDISSVAQDAVIGFTVGKQSGVIVDVQAFGSDILYPYGISNFILNYGDSLVLVPRENPFIGSHSWWAIVLPMSGITGQTTSISQQLVPTGAIIAVVGTAAPLGYLKLNGALINRSTYANLWAYAQASGNIITEGAWGINGNGSFSTGNLTTTFRLPDFRGEFIRGFDDSRGVDSGRVIGQWQSESVNTNGIQMRDATSNWASSGSGVGSSVNYLSNTNIAAYGTNNVLFGGSETRPRNLPVTFCIKY